MYVLISVSGIKMLQRTITIVVVVVVNIIIIIIVVVIRTQQKYVHHFTNVLSLLIIDQSRFLLTWPSIGLHPATVTWPKDK